MRGVFRVGGPIDTVNGSARFPRSRHAISCIFDELTTASEQGKQPISTPVRFPAAPRKPPGNGRFFRFRNGLSRFVTMVVDMSDLRTRIAAVVAEHSRLDALDPSRIGQQRCLCGKWIGGDDLDRIVSIDDAMAYIRETWSAHVADAVTDLLIDMAGQGELLKAIDRMYR